MLHHFTVTHWELQSFLGLCNLCLPHYSESSLLLRLHDLIISVSASHHHINLSRKARGIYKHEPHSCKLLTTNLFFGIIIGLPHLILGSSLMLQPLWGMQQYLVHIGLLFIALYFFLFHITVLDLVPIALALELWGHLWPNGRVRFYSDNSASVFIINKQTSKDPKVMVLLRL